MSVSCFVRYDIAVGRAWSAHAMKAEEVWRSPWLDGNEEQA